MPWFRDLDSADALFQSGKFPEAEKLYAKVAERDATNPRALLQLGRLALLSNRFSEAERWLKSALGVKQDDPAAQQLLFETYSRQDRFADAASLLRGGKEALKLQVLDGFKGLEPYRIEGSSEEAHLTFVQTDPIPVVKVRVNGHEAYFIIDTGGSEVYLEPDFAKEIGAVLVSGAETGGFAGGQTRPVQKGRIDSLTLDRFVVKNVPVNIVDTKFIGRDEVAKGIKISGFLGTILLYHFLPTIDYPKGELTLWRKTEANRKRFEDQAKLGETVSVPFWMAGDHLMVTWASAHRSEQHLFLIDTGGAGVGFVPGPSFIKKASISLPSGDSGQKMVALQIHPFTADEVAVGPLTEHNIPAVLGPFPQQMENSLGFYMAGIVSHEFFKHYAFTLDFTKMRYYLKRGA
jgi:hypothetical protein